MGRQIYNIVRRRIKGRTIVHQRKVFCILFTIFITTYIIILIFIETIFKFIKIITTILVKELLGILSSFYNNSKGAKKGEESK